MTTDQKDAIQTNDRPKHGYCDCGMPQSYPIPHEHSQRYPGEILKRFWSKVEKTETCWNWKGTITFFGYGRFYVNKARKNAVAHRFSYELHVGEIPEKMEIDHLCKNRRCVNPKHMRIVTSAQNTTENSNSPSALNKLKTHCPRGHPLSGHNLTINHVGARTCKTCRARQSGEQREKRRLAAQ